MCYIYRTKDITENECGYCLDDNLYVVIFTGRRISQRISVTAWMITSMLLYLQDEGYHRERVWLLPG